MARSLERLRKQYAAKPGDMRKMGGGPRGGPPGGGMTGKPKNAGQTVKRLLSYVGRYWYKLVLVLLCMLVTTVTSLCGGYLMAPIVDHLALAVNPDTVITMSPIEKIADRILSKITAGEMVQNWIASVMDADQIIVMNEGKITGVGTHEELLASNTEYKEIAESQLGKKGA